MIENYMVVGLDKYLKAPEYRYCSLCDGSGATPCDCSGDTDCLECKGKGKVVCSECEGYGEVEL